MELNYGDHRPIYEQIKEKTKEYIVNGMFSEHEKLPSVREVAAQLAINPNTIHRAYRELEAEGYIYSQKAKGYFVAPMKKGAKEDRADELLKEISSIVRELRYLGTTENEICKHISNIYKEA